MASITNIASSDLISNSREDINNNFTNLNNDKIETSVLDTDTSLTANSDTKIATQKAVRAYVDSGGQQNASETVRGLVEEATAAEITAGTDTGGTGAKLFAPPSKLNTQIDTKIAAISLVKKIEIDTTEITVGNTTTETTLFDVAIPAGTLSTNNAIRIKSYIDFSLASGGGATTIFALKYGATTIATLTFTASGGSNNTIITSGILEGYVVADGATNAQKGCLSFLSGAKTAFASAEATTADDGAFGAAKGSATEDSTAQKTLTLTVDFGGASALSTVTADFWIVEKIA